MYSLITRKLACFDEGASGLLIRYNNTNVWGEYYENLYKLTSKTGKTYLKRWFKQQGVTYLLFSDGGEQYYLLTDKLSWRHFLYRDIDPDVLFSKVDSGEITMVQPGYHKA